MSISHQTHHLIAPYSEDPYCEDSDNSITTTSDSASDAKISHSILDKIHPTLFLLSLPRQTIASSMCKYIKYIRPKCGHEIETKWCKDPSNPHCQGKCPKPLTSPEPEEKRGKNSQECKEDSSHLNIWEALGA
ncbi:hypothetical protein HD806DRAFT_531882 [Xylariaceae sp. AK1471]|nr:hypothetical protein HD806DRAFT_531882 [Xylariaceae sp. AK1471]